VYTEDDTFRALQRTPFEDAITPSVGLTLEDVMGSILKWRTEPTPEWYLRPSSRGWTWPDIRQECMKRLQDG
jgi:hypothetical protein